jgi:phage terminase Nu1 subunit (DNA packaging protein)
VKNRITDALAAISDANLRAQVRIRERAKAQALTQQLRTARSRLSIVVLTHVHPTDGRITFRHVTLFVNDVPAVVLHTYRVPT